MSAPTLQCPDCSSVAPLTRWQITADRARCPYCSSAHPLHAVDVVSW